MSARGCFHEGCDAVHSPPGDFGPPCVCAFATPDGGARADALREANVRALRGAAVTTASTQEVITAAPELAGMFRIFTVNWAMPVVPQNIALARLAPRAGDVTPGNRGGGGA